MSRYTTAALALALGASAAPHWPHWGGNGGNGGWGSGSPGGSYGGGSEPSGGASGGFPSFPATSVAAPTGGFPAPSGGSPPPFSYSQIANATAPVYVGAATASSSSFSVSYVPSATASSNGTSPEVTDAPAAPPAGGAASGGDIPAASGTSVLSAVQTIAAGESFDGGMFSFDRGVSCTGQSEGGDSDAVFEIEDGGSLSNVIIGPDQIEGVHCYGSCTLTNVWWSAVCEDAFTIKEQADGGVTTISGGGAFGAEDKVLQHNGGGTLSVSGFTVSDFGKLYRSCGNCDEMPQRHVIFDDITASEGSILAGINSNYGDTATFTNIKASGVEDICVTFTGNDTGDEPEENGSGPSESCIYSESDITQS